MKFCDFLFLTTSFLSQMAKKALKSESSTSTTVKEDKQPAPEPVEKPLREPARWERCPFVMLAETLGWCVGSIVVIFEQDQWFDLLTCYWVTRGRHCGIYRAHPGKMGILKTGRQILGRSSWLAITQRFFPSVSLSLPHLYLLSTSLLIPHLLMQCSHLWIRFPGPVNKAEVTRLDVFGGPVGDVKEQSGSRIIQLRARDWDTERACFPASCDCCYVSCPKMSKLQFKFLCETSKNFFLRFPNFWMLAVSPIKKKKKNLNSLDKTHLPAGFGLQAASLPSPNSFYLKHPNGRWTLFWKGSFSKTVWHSSHSENSQDPIYKCSVGERGQNGGQSFTSLTWGLD